MNKYYCYIKLDDMNGYDLEIYANSYEEAFEKFLIIFRDGYENK